MKEDTTRYTSVDYDNDNDPEDNEPYSDNEMARYGLYEFDQEIW